MNGYDRLKHLYMNRKNKQRDNTLIKIIQYLLKQPNMNERYLSENKDLIEMMKYITYKAKEQSVNDTAVIEDDIVYNWAIDYFKNDNDVINFKDELEEIDTTLKEEVNNQLNLELK